MFDEVDFRGFLRRPVSFAVDFNSVNIGGLKFSKTDVSPFGHFVVAIEDRKSEKELAAVIFGDEQVASADEEM